MAVNILCDLCNRKIATVATNKVRDYVQEHGEICGTCQKKMARVDAMFKKKEERFSYLFNKLVENAKEELSQEIRKMAAEDGADDS